AEVSARTQASPQPPQFFAGAEEVFYHFGSGNKVIGVFKNRAVVGIKRIINPHAVPLSLKQNVQRGTRSRPEIESLTFRFQQLIHRLSQLVQKPAVSFVAGIVFVGFVALKFFLGGGTVLRRRKNQPAALALVKITAVMLGSV